MSPGGQIRVVCVDDNPAVAHALGVTLSRAGLHCVGTLAGADGLVHIVREACPDVVLLDVDMPGKDPFEAVLELVGICPDVRVLFLSGHVRRQLVDRAIECGAWGYLSKSDSTDAIPEAIRRCVAGEVVFSPEVAALLA